jgi:hypothetical protein
METRKFACWWWLVLVPAGAAVAGACMLINKLINIQDCNDKNKLRPRQRRNFLKN